MSPEERNLSVVLAKAWELTLRASGVYLSLPEPFTVVNRMECSDWPGVSHIGWGGRRVELALHKT